FSKDRINKWYGLFSKKKISVIYNGVRELSVTSVDFSDLEKKLSIDRDKFVLTVGNVKPHKNFRALVEFWNDSNTDIPLVIVGEKDNFRTKDKFETSNKNVVYTGRVSDEELSLLYSKAKFFVYPSLYEGFGLPLLEAMQSNLPIAASDIPVFKELASGRISYFSPSDFTGLKSFVDSKSTNDKEFVDYSDILDCFSWDKCVNELIEVFDFESSACK
ncbi:glycosyltransferase family 4 protein, partial [Vibrio vulnificus]|nr:glycosyltransferase family 4 protein [Vibrio vulnificus]